jgi:hypothetical protein
MEGCEMKWEELKGHWKIWRSKVPGGWIVLVDGYVERSITFYPDPNHEWDGKSLD